MTYFGLNEPSLKLEWQYHPSFQLSLSSSRPFVHPYNLPRSRDHVQMSANNEVWFLQGTARVAKSPLEVCWTIQKYHCIKLVICVPDEFMLLFSKNFVQRFYGTCTIETQNPQNPKHTVHIYFAQPKQQLNHSLCFSVNRSKSDNLQQILTTPDLQFYSLQRRRWFHHWISTHLCRSAAVEKVSSMTSNLSHENVWNH